jgi:hypothetical protein
MRRRYCLRPTWTRDTGGVRLTVAGRGGESWSIDQDDSHQSQLTDQFSLRDIRLRTTATLGIQPDRGPFRIALEAVNGSWDNSLPGHTFTAREETLGAMILAGW